MGRGSREVNGRGVESCRRALFGPPAIL